MIFIILLITSCANHDVNRLNTNENIDFNKDYTLLEFKKFRRRARSAKIFRARLESLVTTTKTLSLLKNASRSPAMEALLVKTQIYSDKIH